MVSSYPKVFNLGHRAITDLFQGEVFVEEKVDGSQFSFGKDLDGKLFAKSHHSDLEIEAPEKLFSEAVRVVKELEGQLRPGWIYRGEYLRAPKHNTLAYDRVPLNHIVIFDVETAPQCFLRPDMKNLAADELGLEVVPLLALTEDGASFSKDTLDALLQTTSFLGGQKVEGVVIKNYDRICPLTGHVLMGKHVSEEFKEIHQGDWKDRHPAGRDIKDQLIELLATPARWDKAILHLREQGKLLNEPADIGPLMKEICQDTLAEAAEEMRERLFKWAWKDVSRGLTRGFPEYYKNKLAEAQFATAPGAELSA